jgi:hypothetical protein
MERLMEPEAIYTILSVFFLAVIISRRPSVVEEPFEDSDISPQLMDDLLSDLYELAGIAEEVVVTRNNGETVKIRYRKEEKPAPPVATATSKEGPDSRLVWSQDGRSLQRETLNWGGEQ